MEQARSGRAGDDLGGVVRRLYAALAGDVEGGFEELLAPEGLLMIGTAPEEWWEGRDEVARVFRAQAAARGEVEIVDSSPAIREAGAVGWVADRVTVRLSDGMEIPMRITLVWRRADGAWRLVQGHASVGIGNAEAFDRDVTL